MIVIFFNRFKFKILIFFLNVCNSSMHKKWLSVTTSFGSNSFSNFHITFWKISIFTIFTYLNLFLCYMNSFVFSLLLSTSLYIMAILIFFFFSIYLFKLEHLQIAYEINLVSFYGPIKASYNFQITDVYNTIWLIFNIKHVYMLFIW